METLAWREGLLGIYKMTVQGLPFSSPLLDSLLATVGTMSKQHCCCPRSRKATLEDRETS